MDISRRLAQYVADIHYEDLDMLTIEATRKSILDALGVTLAASGLCEACHAFVNVAAYMGGTAECSIIGFNTKAPMAAAALANGAMAHALDFEDAHDNALVHPNAAAIPAAFAVAQSLCTVTGKQLIEALAPACDLVCRLGLALTKNPMEYGWYPPAILGAFGATAAAGKLLRLDRSQMCDAFSLTLCQATCSAELRHSPHSDIRAVRDSFAAQTGVLSALIAREGVRGFDAPFEGKAGFYNLYARGNYAPERLTDKLGQRFEGARLSFKPWPACRGTHAFIEAALFILAEHAIATEDIERIHAIVSPLNLMLCEPIEIKQRPATVIDAKFSLPFIVATALIKKRVTLEDIKLSSLSNQDVLRLAAKMTFEVDHTINLDEATQGSLEICTSTERFYRHVKIPFGNPENPMSQEDLVKKFMGCAANARNVPDEKILNEVVERIWALEKESNVGDIISGL